MATVPTTFNPSDYEFLLKSVTEGNLVSKAQSLKRLNTLVITDKKQFSIYAKRVVISIQDLLYQPKEDINLLASTLVLQIINLNPREIQYYIRTKLLKNMVKNLGDPKPQIRKTSHYCLLAYVKTYKTFDELIQVYIHYGFESDTWQLRQKSINSFQSILIMEMKYLNWSSNEFRKIVEQLLAKTKDESQYVQKAAEQCLVSICKYEQVRGFSKKLPPTFYNTLKDFCQAMLDQGMLAQMKLYVPELPPAMVKNYSTSSVYVDPPGVKNIENPIVKNIEKPIFNLNIEKIKNEVFNNNNESFAQKQAILSKIEDLRKKTHTPMLEKKFVEEKQQKQRVQEKALKKAESVSVVPRRIASREKSLQLPSLRKSIQVQETQIRNNLKSQKNEAAIGRKLIDDLKNQKDWKIRLQAIQQLQTKFNASKGTPEAESMAKNFLPILIKLLGDPNFKVALIALKLIEEILSFENINQSPIVPLMVQKITDGKIALRQNISKLIRSQFNRTGNKTWIIQVLGQLKKSPPPNSNIKQEILNILSKITIQAQSSQNMARMQTICLSLQQIIQAICPLMDDLKTKIKIKTLDLLILLSVKTNNIQLVKSIVASKLNQVYFEMYMQKIAKQLKNMVINGQNERGTTAGDRKNRMSTTNRRYNRLSGGNTTSSTLRKYSSVQNMDEHNSTAKTALFTARNNEMPDKLPEEELSSVINHKQTQPLSPSKKTIIKSYRKKNFDYKNTQYSAFSANNNGIDLPPFQDPEKQLKNILAEIKSDQWQTCSEALTKLRRIIENHSDLLNISLVKLLVPENIRLVQSLRSNLSKNAVITLYQMSNKLTKMLDSQLDLMFSKLLKKTLDANSFISQQVRRALVSICSNCNQNRVVTLLFNSHTSRAVPIKISIVNVIQSIIFLPKVYQKQLERIVNILVNFLSEGSLQIRQKSKSILLSLLTSQKAEQIAKLIPSEHLHKLSFRLSKAHEKSEIKNNEAENTQKREEMNQGQQNKKKKQKITVFPEQFQTLQPLLEQCQSSDWKNREKNMTTIYQTIIQPYPKQFAQHKLGGRVMDVLSKQVGDHNVKVATNALKILQILPRKIPEVIEHNLSVLVNELFNCFGSHKPEIKSLAEELFDIIAENIQKWMLIQHMCNGALYGLQKSRPIILQRLTDILPSVYAKGNKKTLLSKNLYPMINKLAEQGKPQNLEGLTQLMKTCNYETEGQFLNSLKPKAIQLYNSIKQQ